MFGVERKEFRPPIQFYSNGVTTLDAMRKLLADPTGRQSASEEEADEAVSRSASLGRLLRTKSSHA